MSCVPSTTANYGISPVLKFLNEERERQYRLREPNILNDFNKWFRWAKMLHSGKSVDSYDLMVYIDIEMDERLSYFAKHGEFGLRTSAIVRYDYPAFKSILINNIYS